MKKIISLLIIFMLTLIVIPTNVFAEDERARDAVNPYTSLNLDEALTLEDIEHDFSDYEETDDKAIVYLFRGQGCGYCKRFLTFLNSIVPEYGKYFRVVSYEVWQDENNSALLNDVSTYMEEEASGVPYIVIGDKVFAGYAEQYDEDIKKAIKDLYESENRYDVMTEMVQHPKEKKEKKADSNYTKLLVINGSIIAVAGIVGTVIYLKKKSKEA